MSYTYSLCLELLTPPTSAPASALPACSSLLAQGNAFCHSFLHSSRPSTKAKRPRPAINPALTHALAQRSDRRIGPVSVAVLLSPFATTPVLMASSPCKTQALSLAQAAPRGRFTPQSPPTSAEPQAQTYPLGVLHLYRHPLPSPSNDTAPATTQTSPRADGRVVAVLAVPAYMGTADFVAFLGGYRDTISHIRIVRDSMPNRYIAVLKFRQADDARHFQKTYSGRPFNSLQPETCHVVTLASIHVEHSVIPDYALSLFYDSLGHCVDTSSAERKPLKSTAISLLPSTSADSQVARPMGSGIELPSCPVCLESLDSSATGLLTIQCQHTFHCQCLSRWGDSSCPVCRYSAINRRVSSALVTQYTSHSTKGDQPAPATSPPQPMPPTASTSGQGSRELVDPPPVADSDGGNDEDQQCSVCHSGVQLWICLICAHIGCGRYQSGHAYHHFGETGHVYALELETQRVWDYVREGYVHRLIQNKTDGKLVELPDPEPSTAATRPVVPEEKVDAISLEYTNLLTSQLESQRLYYESQMADITHQWQQTTQELATTQRDRHVWRDKCQESETHLARLKDTCASLEQSNTALEKQVEQTTGQLAKLDKQFQEESGLNASLRANQASLRALVTKRDQQIAELQEQVQDLMAYFSMQEKVANDASLQGADVGVRANPTATSSKRRGKQR
ncbi:hypothetical protein H4R34_000863 [Dimargaris verticillata]|uniref:BRCA1-associated protein 2-domain-containing protein n=1 Tax=Dimargaris verticillata TaxID=2761393 RepID=A0A9W8BB18_9FUNG|nr:hypothetical protein H4R34_000863 [Dimargaris verticillata]